MKIDTLFPLSYCLNLDKRTDRWTACQKEFQKISFYPERFTAIERQNPAEGCWLSHIEMLKTAKQKNENILIFEDDIEIINYKDNLVEKTFEELSKISWDMVYLGGNVLKPFYQTTEHLGKLTHCQSTHAYGVNKEFVSKLLAFIEANRFIVDVLYAEYVIPNNNCFITIPMVAIQRADYSDIEKRQMDYSIPIARYNYFLVKKPLTK